MNCTATHDAGNCKATHRAAAHHPTPARQKSMVEKVSRRECILYSVNAMVLADAALSAPDGRTIVNSLLGAYGLPQVRGTTGFRVFDDPNAEWVVEYPSSWLSRVNRLRQGVTIADFNSSDKLAVEMFSEPENPAQLISEVVQHLVSPGSGGVGGDSRLALPSGRDLKTETSTIAGQDYIYLSFPSATTTRSGYDIKRKNTAVAAVRNGQVYACVASARSDQYNLAKKELLERVVQSFKLRESA